MTPFEIILTVRSDGITLTVADAGEIKVAGKAELVNRWVPVIREHKAAIVQALSSATEVVNPMLPREERAIRRWLAHIEEHDPELIAYAIERCRTDRESREYFLRRSAEVPPVVAPVTRIAASCAQCVHRGGRHDTYFGCMGREDLPLLYGRGHPLRQLPDDGGSSCATFAANPTRH